MLYISQLIVYLQVWLKHVVIADADFGGIGPPARENGLPAFSLKMNQLERQPELMLQLEAASYQAKGSY